MCFRKDFVEKNKGKEIRYHTWSKSVTVTGNIEVDTFEVDTDSGLAYISFIAFLNKIEDLKKWSVETK